MAIANFNDLKASIEDWLDRDDLLGVVEDFITIAEARINREIRTRDLIVRSQVTLSTSTRYLCLPNDFLEMKRFSLNTNPVCALEQVSAHLLAARFLRSGSGKPSCYAIHEEIEFDVTPDNEYTAEMVYYKRVDALSNANPTNIILERHPDLYLYSSLAAAESYVANDERIELWETLYVKVREDANKNHRLGQYTSGSVAANPQMQTP